jgi:hypothetical protein
MDTKTLVVGQDVLLVSNEIYCEVGTVVAVTPSGVDVQTGVMQIDGTWNGHERIRFDKEGKETETSRRDRLGFGPSPGDKFHNILWFSAPEFQPYQIEENVSAEKLAAFKAKIGVDPS